MNYFKKGFFGIFILSNLLISGTLYAQVSVVTTSTDGSNDSTTTRRSYIRGWRQDSNELQQKINMLDSTSVTSVPVPVLFGVEINNISPNFGDPRSNGRTHAGEDIMAVKGTPIISPTPAVVLRTGVGSGEGIYVYTANPGGETFVYMHLDRLGEGIIQGTVLERGSLIGYVGNTGNASGGAAHLHFEIHNSDGTAVDPFPRLTSTFTLQEKNIFLTKILTQTSDTNSLSAFLVTNFRQTFNQSQSLGINLPTSILQYMSSLANTTTNISTTVDLPRGDLTLGSKGYEVILLQEYLISKNTGPSAMLLAKAGATGNFGYLTKSALIEYQLQAGITPANGYYGQATRSLVLASPIATSTTVVTPTITSTVVATPITLLTRNLYLGTKGEDVRTLQKFLNTHGYLVSSVGVGSPNNETIYFGKATQSAVIRFQVAQNITPAVGYVGQITRARITE